MIKKLIKFFPEPVAISLIVALILTIPFLFASCSTKETIHTITQLEFIKPDIPRLRPLPKPEIETIQFKKITMDDGTILYALPKTGAIAVSENQRKLKEAITSYEEMIEVYQEFYQEYNQKNERKLP